MTTRMTLAARHAPPEKIPRSDQTRLAARLASARRRRFVGREAELALFRAALQADESPFAVLFIYGPGGVGKTTLLHAYEELAAECGRPVIYLDGRSMEPSSRGWLLALREKLGVIGDEHPLMPDWPDGAVLLLDTYETLEHLDEWLRESVFPHLPDNGLVVIAGRHAPAPAWRTDLAWSELAHAVSLRNLRPEESKSLLATRGIPTEHHADILAVTHGHPLALCLVADTMAQNNRLSDIDLHAEPDIVRTLLARFVQEIPSAQHRLGLEICVLAWATTETLLVDVLGAEDAYRVFEWLRELSFVEQGAQGLYPHDLARDVLDTDYRWRNVEAHRSLHRQLVAHLSRRVERASHKQQQRLWFDLLYLARHNPYMKPYFDWKALGGAYAEPMQPEDLPAILAMVEAHEGEHSAQIAHYWWQRQPQAFLAYRSDGELIGFMAHLALHQASLADLDTDPALPAALAFVERYGPVRPGEEMLHLRFWMGRDAYQGVSPAINLTAINSSIHWTTRPKLAWNFVATGDPVVLEPHFTMINVARAPEADFVVGNRRFGVFAHDWRVQPAAAWMEHKAERYGVTDVALNPSAPAPRETILVLSEPEFLDAVRRAVRDYARPDLLANSPLLRSRLVVDAAREDPVDALRQLLAEALTQLQATPKDQKLYRALWRTYFEPIGTQEQTAEWLDLPFSTYRNHLAGGLERTAAWLWQREIYGFNR